MIATPPSTARTRDDFSDIERIEDELLVHLVDAREEKIIKKAHESLLGSPVNLKLLARDLGVQYRNENMPSGIYGFLEKTSAGFVIGIKYDDIWTRKRFTFAHELAHFLLHRDRLEEGQAFRENVFLLRDTESKNVLSRADERQANRLAAHILMPISKLREAFAPGQPMYTVAALAKIFDVSLQAMQIRLGLPPDTLVISPSY